MAQYPLTFPTKAPATETIKLNRRQSATESPFTYQVQVVNTAAQWQLEWSWPRMRHADAERCAAWLTSLRGQIGTFRYQPRQSIKSTLTGRSVATAAFAYNNAVSIGGWSANAASTLRPGQWFQIGDQLLRITEAGASADASGRVTISFEPELRTNFAAGTAVNFATPAGLFRLASSDGAGYTLDTDRNPEIGTIGAREVTG